MHISTVGKSMASEPDGLHSDKFCCVIFTGLFNFSVPQLPHVSWGLITVLYLFHMIARGSPELTCLSKYFRKVLGVLPLVVLTLWVYMGNVNSRNRNS